MSTIDTIGSRHRPNESRDAASSAAGFLHRLAVGLAKRRSRIHLSELSDDQLRDIGITKSQARREIARRFWD